MFTGGRKDVQSSRHRYAERAQEFLTMKEAAA
jgi:hypothetical protein